MESRRVFRFEVGRAKVVRGGGKGTDLEQVLLVTERLLLLVPELVERVVVSVVVHQLDDEDDKLISFVLDEL